MMNRSCRVVAALLFLLLARSEVGAQRPLGTLQARDFQDALLSELELQRRTPTPIFREIDPVFMITETAINRVAYDPATGVLRWRYSLRPGVGRVRAARVVGRLRRFLVDSLIKARLITEAQYAGRQFRIEVVGEEPLPEEELPPGGGEVETPGAPPPVPRQPPENAPQTGGTTGTTGSTGSTGYVSYYYPCWGCGWGYPYYWGWGWDCYYCYPGWGCGWGGYPWWTYYPVAYPTAVVAYPTMTVVAAAPIQTVATMPVTALAQAPRTNGNSQLADGRLSRVSLYHRPVKEAALEDRSSSPTFWRQATGANPDGLFWDGYTLYWQGHYREALDSFESALAERRDDARFWYYKALCEKKLGQARAAGTSARQARTLRAQGLPAVEQIGAALERVQGADRRFLNGEADALAAR